MMPESAGVHSSTSKVLSRLRAEKFGRYALLMLVIGAGIVFFSMVRVFLVPVVLAAVFVGLFYPFYEWLLRRSGNRRGLSAFIACLVLLIGLLLPAYGVANLVAKEAMEFYQDAEVTTKGAWDPNWLKSRIERYPLLRSLNLDAAQWQMSFDQVAREGASLVATFINKASKETFQLVANLFLTFFTMFYFFRDGQMLLGRLKDLSPLSKSYLDEIIHRFASVSRATVKGTLLVGVLKGFLGGLTFWAFGIQGPVLWGVVMTFLSVLPVVGAWLVMCPAAIFLMLNDQVWQGIALFLIAVVVISSIDNFLEPVLVARGSGMHDLLVFFSILGGVGAFGVMGFIVGPLIAALFRALLDIYRVEFSKQLSLVHEPPPRQRVEAEFEI